MQRRPSPHASSELYVLRKCVSPPVGDSALVQLARPSTPARSQVKSAFILFVRLVDMVFLNHGLTGVDDDSRMGVGDFVDANVVVDTRTKLGERGSHATERAVHFVGERMSLPDIDGVRAAAGAIDEFGRLLVFSQPTQD